MNFIALCIPLFFLSMAIEFAWSRFAGHGGYRLNDTLNSLHIGMMNQSIKLLKLGFAGAVVGPAVAWLGVEKLPRDAAWVWVTAFVLCDFLYYWQHRLGHEWRLLWASHVVHHQSEEFNLSTAFRQTSTDYLGFLFMMPLYLLGYPVYVVVSVYTLNLVYQFWVHTRHVGRLGVLDRILMTPSNHRVHHARNSVYIDKNYAGVFLLWDRLFGTYQKELPEDPCRYGITRPLNSWNPVWANLHAWLAAARTAWQARRWRDKVALWFRSPGWMPEGAVEPAPAPAWDGPRYDPPVSRHFRFYCLLQYLVIATAAFTLTGTERWLPAGFTAVAVALIVASGFAQGRMLEGRDDSLRYEWARVSAVVLFALLAPVAWPSLPGWVSAAGLFYGAVSGLLLSAGNQWFATVDDEKA